MRQLPGAWRHMNITWAFDELAQDAQGLFRIFESVRGDDFPPFLFAALKLSREGRRGGWGMHLASEHMLEKPPHLSHVLAVRAFESADRTKAHQARKALVGRGLRGDRMRLPIIVHL